MKIKNRLQLLTAAFSVSLLPLGLPLSVKAEMTQPQIIAQNNEVICASNQNRVKKCPINTRNGVILIEQLSNASCDGNWDYGDGYVEVRNGCRAKFAPEQRRNGNNNSNSNNGNNNNVTCESSGNRSRRCSINTRNGVVLVRQLSNASCDGNWDYGDGYVEVRNGCRGEFARDNNNRNNNNNSSNNSSNNGMLKARAAYETILIDRNSNFVIGLSQGQLIYVNCNDITRIEGDKRVFAMDGAGNKGYILVNAVDGASCNW